MYDDDLRISHLLFISPCLGGGAVGSFSGRWSSSGNSILFLAKGSCYVKGVLLKNGPRQLAKDLVPFNFAYRYYFLKLYLHHSSKIKSHQEVTKQLKYRFFLLFLPDD
jgi:hypothetical protein